MTFRFRFLIVPAAILAGACAVNPATGKKEFMLVSESQELAMGKQYDQQLVVEMGLYDDSALAGYVQSLGLRLAALSERPQLPWTFRLVDDPVVNAFAVPGGYIYVTRGILANMGSEAQLVSVLGHEIGHVTARHTAKQITQQQVFGLGLSVGAMFSPTIAGLASNAVQILFLKFSRDDESQADELGFRYMRAAHYDPREAADMFSQLSRVTNAGGGRLPEWQSTHPDPGNRVIAAQQRLAESQIEGGIVRRDEYLRHIDGLLFGEDPAQGFFVEGRFVHPVLRLQFRFPEGWASQNAPTSVLAQSPDKDAVMQVTLGQGSTPEEAANAFFDQQGIERLGARSRTVNGLPAVQGTFRVTTEQGTLDGEVLFVKHGDLVFRFMGYTPTSRMGTYAVTFERSLESFAPMNEERWINLAPRRLEIVRVPDEMTAERFFERFPSTVTLETVLQINGWKTGQVIPAGSSAKRVVGEGVPGDE